jgi:hypothetical protein
MEEYGQIASGGRSYPLLLTVAGLQGAIKKGAIKVL